MLKSRKFWYSVATLVAVLVTAFVPPILGLDEAASEALLGKLDFIFYVGLFLLVGHSVQDSLSMAVGKQLPSAEDAIEGVQDAINNPNS
jgi:hypothetical protein